jgi:phosphatidylinositol-3-phosphatase
VAKVNAGARIHARRLWGALLCCVALGVAACGSASGTPIDASTPTASQSTAASRPPSALPAFDHIVVVVEENHGYSEIVGSPDAPYINALAKASAVFTDSHAVTHPSQPNYLALFAGSTFGVTSDACPQSFATPNLGGGLRAKGRSFAGYSESLPSAGYVGCSSADGTPDYARKHNPWSDFADVAAASNLPFSAFPSDYASLPSVAFVVPNQQHDMHSGSVATGDGWLHAHMDGYIQWARTHNSLLILTWDEDDSSSSANHILTLFAGAHVHAGEYAETITHYDVLRTVEALEAIPYTWRATSAHTIADVWQA